MITVRLFTDGGEGPKYQWPEGLIEEFRAAYRKCLALGPNLSLAAVVNRMKPEMVRKAHDIDSWRMFRDAYRREVVRSVKEHNDEILIEVRKKR